jgi:lipopolysaccharide transport system ATP-binding protein
LYALGCNEIHIGSNDLPPFYFMTSSDNEVLIKVENVSKKFCRDFKKSLWYGLKDTATDILHPTHKSADSILRPSEFWANQNLSFEVKRGECLGLIGHNGAGKTTLLKMLNGLIKPDTGSITMKGRIGALIALGAGFNPILTGRENIYVNGSILGLHKKEIDAKLDEIVNFAEIEDAIDAPVRTYSSGMQVRLGFSVASTLKPNILLVDEVLAVGDIAFQRKCLTRMNSYIEDGGGVILVSHQMHLIQAISSSGILMNQGKIHTTGEIKEVVAQYFDLQKGKTLNELSLRELTANNPVRIEKVEVSNGEDDQSSLTIKVHYRSLKANPKVHWGFSLWKQNIRLATNTSQWDGKNCALAKGVGTLECKIPDLPLIPDLYSLRIGIYDANTSWPLARVGWEDDAPIDFKLPNKASEAFNRRKTSDDVIFFDVEWS